MNLKEIVEKNNLKVGDSVLCTYSGSTDLELGEHGIVEGDGLFPRLIGNGRLWVGDSCLFELIGKKRHVHADLYNEAVNDLSIKWQHRSPGSVFYNDFEWDGDLVNFHPKLKYRKRPSQNEVDIEMLFDASDKLTVSYIDDLHCLAKKIHELKGQKNNA